MSVLHLWVFALLIWLPLTGSAKPLQQLKILAPEIPGAAESSLEGRDIELVLASFEECGFKAEFIMQPYERHARTYRDRQDFDGIMTVPLHWRLPGHSTSAYIWYQNGAFYNHSRVGPIERIKDLAGLHVVTFREGVDVLGIRDNVPEFASLTEIANQTIHSRLLFMGRVDAILADGFVVAEVNRRIFSAKRRGEMWPSQGDAFRFAPIFNPAPHKMVFRDAELAEAFDRCFDRLRGSGVVGAINQKYIDKYQDVLRFRYLGR
ncbi:amino acid ABC transporter substrate-binding protein [Marinobacter sp. BW6]|uniref:transporter substrate-binding domain-containing protein n=1 Tax=Marinobacter sp. BW6 TaxID=2592624 RepID=UPI0011DEA106|nr:transporter substrate-binding domain-containing protein [Marinobacter sp. BW6]TYC57685.1 amino acid ABC transporter substrate-binding protein [Marinobacter sp. BW6]